MHNSIKYILAFFTLYYSYSIAKAQVAINITGNDPDSTAMLDISSTDKGILIPRMNSSEREAIANGTPATALLVFDTETASFWFYDGNNWAELSSGTATLLEDADKDTKIQVEETPDADTILFNVRGSELMQLINPTNFSAQRNVIDDDFNGAESVYAEDIDGDGDMDIVGAAFSANQIAWWDNDGNANFTKKNINGGFNGAQSVYAADIDGDGNMDVIGAAANIDQIAWWRNDGNENFTKHIIDEDFERANSVYAEDIDGDGDMDVLGTAFFDNDIAWWENDGNENFTKHIIGGNFERANSVYAKDIDGDGNIDVLGTAEERGEVAWWRNDGNENFTKNIIVRNFNGAQSVYAADVDGDGNMDVMAAARFSNQIAWWKNDGNENFSKQLVDDNFNGAKSVYAVDIDDDGDMDILGASINGANLAWWENSGRATFTRKIIDGSFSLALSVYAADVDGDGDMDILGAASNVDNLSWWENEANSNTTLNVNGRLSASAFSGDGAALTNVPSDDLGNHIATQPLDLANFDLNNVDTIRANALIGDGAGLVNVPSDDLGNHIATQSLDLANFNLNNGNKINANTFDGANTAVFGDINLGDEGQDQSNSGQLGKGYTTTPWIYANAIQSPILRGTQASLVAIGGNGYGGGTNSIHLITKSISRLMVASDGKVGIGTNNPKATLDLHSGDDGVSARIVARRGSRNSYIALEGPIGSPYHSSIDVGQFTTGTNRKAIYISNEDNSSFGYVGIGRRALTYRLEVNGNASKNAAGDWFANSDARLKTNIQQLNAEQTLQQLLTLKGVTYEWDDNKTGTDRPEGIQYGFTAQNIQEVFPTLVEEDAQGYLQTAYGTYDAMYVESFRALLDRIEHLEAENEQLKLQSNKIEALEAQLVQIQAQINQ